MLVGKRRVHRVDVLLRTQTQSVGVLAGFEVAEGLPIHADPDTLVGVDETLRASADLDDLDHAALFGIDPADGAIAAVRDPDRARPHGDATRTSTNRHRGGHRPGCRIDASDLVVERIHDPDSAHAHGDRGGAVSDRNGGPKSSRVDAGDGVGVAVGDPRRVLPRPRPKSARSRDRRSRTIRPVRASSRVSRPEDGAIQRVVAGCGRGPNSPGTRPSIFTVFETWLNWGSILAALTAASVGLVPTTQIAPPTAARPVGACASLTTPVTLSVLGSTRETLRSSRLTHPERA